ncbi:hypothetical protein [Kitasatospora sp. CB02891]|uniref:hypothetical protein n=1 Tax=Kitasatospora sp. CB02891 TaxID=2020329 RepID=UPI000C2723F5|nr:hypothetical protein [Kitasatospora sp. CB02891]PJN22038.1 hypothetical protein CG736_29910 [Kitasatospora sp. CB02891]
MNLLGRPATATFGAVLAAAATLATIRVIAHNWMGCATHLEPGSRGALLFFVPVCFVLLTTGGAVTGLLSRGIRRHLEAPELVRLFAVVLGIALTALAIGALLAGPGTNGCFPEA